MQRDALISRIVNARIDIALAEERAMHEPRRPRVVGSRKSREALEDKPIPPVPERVRRVGLILRAHSKRGRRRILRRRLRAMGHRARGQAYRELEELLRERLARKVAT